jgi:hypothetical protein
MFTRAAILIESSDISGEQDLPGARVDVENWRKHLLSKQGGAWESSEITVLNKPNWSTLHRLLEECKKTDYVFITFSGHGYHLSGKGIEETRICLTASDEIAVVSINPGNPRCTFVIDSCRGVVREEELLHEAAEAKSLMKKEASDKFEYRKIFDSAVQQGERGVIRLFSCDLDEAAGESKRSGGYFSRFLVDCCEDWYRETEHGKSFYYPINYAHNKAAKITTSKNPQQHPQYEGGRRRKHFPLAVCP